MKKRLASRARTTRRPSRDSRGRTSQSWHEAVIVDYARLMARPNVERVALGWKERRGKVTSRMAVKIYVSEKRAMVADEEHLPKSAAVLVPVGKGVFRRRLIPTDVVWHAPARFITAQGPFPSGPGQFLNPASSGAMIGVPGHQFGTFGCLVSDANGDAFALTAGHVVQSVPGKIIPKIQLLQPPIPGVGLPPGASPLFGITAGGFLGTTPAGYVDVALLRLLGARAATTDALDGILVDRKAIPLNAVVNNKIACSKFGAATGRTFGMLASFVPSMTINGMIVTDVLEFVGLPGHLFAAPGDSGALVVSRIPNTPPLVIGLLFAATTPTNDAPAGRGFVVPFERIAAAGLKLL